MAELTITVNGEARRLPGPCTVADLLAVLAVDAVRVAVEKNLDVVPKARYATTPLVDGDQLEVVTFVGGGCS